MKRFVALAIIAAADIHAVEEKGDWRGYAAEPPAVASLSLSE